MKMKRFKVTVEERVETVFSVEAASAEEMYAWLDTYGADATSYLTAAQAVRDREYTIEKMDDETNEMNGWPTYNTCMEPLDPEDASTANKKAEFYEAFDGGARVGLPAFNKDDLRKFTVGCGCGCGASFSGISASDNPPSKILMSHGWRFRQVGGAVLWACPDCAD